MRIKRLKLRNFRSYEQAEIRPGEGMTVFLGPNAQGKTNILESMHLCCAGRSHRTSRDEEMIRWGEAAAKVNIETAQRDGTHEVTLVLVRGQKKKKTVWIGARQAERIGELFGHAFGVLFSPEDLQIVKGGPSERRRFIDMQLSQLRPSYFYALQRASRALNQRNALLREVAEKPSLMSTMDAWDEQLAEAGALVVKGRRDVIEALSESAAEEHGRLTEGAEQLRLRYVCEAAKEENPEEFLLRRLAETREDDIRRGTTTTGVHRDDVQITINSKDARIYASQGQQRSAVLSLKLAQTTFAERERQEAPILMLDDVMSELDAGRQNYILNHIEGRQVFITCCDPDAVKRAAVGAKFHIKNGKILN